MEEILYGLYDFITVVGDFLTSLFNDLANLVVMLGETAVEIPDYLNAFLPSTVVTLVISLITIAVVLRVIGRD